MPMSKATTCIPMQLAAPADGKWVLAILKAPIPKPTQLVLLGIMINPNQSQPNWLYQGQPTGLPSHKTVGYTHAESNHLHANATGIAGQLKMGPSFSKNPHPETNPTGFTGRWKMGPSHAKSYHPHANATGITSQQKMGPGHSKNHHHEANPTGLSGHNDHPQPEVDPTGFTEAAQLVSLAVGW